MPEDCRDTIVAQNVVEFFDQFNGDVDQLLAISGAECFQIINERYAVIYYPLDDLDFIQTYHTNYSAIPKLYGLLDTGSSEASGVGDLRRQSELGLLGQGTLVGFVDTGIDYTNPVFLNADGTTRIVSIWDQTVQTGPLPENFGYGSEFSQELLNQALRSANPLEIADTTDVEGHGTFLAGVAAGNLVREENFTGYAPLAGIVMVKLKPAKDYLKRYFCVKEDTLCFQETDIALGIQYLVSVARREGKPIAICVGLGNNLQGHDGSGIVDELLDQLSGRFGMCAVTASGNEGNAACHYRGGIEESRRRSVAEGLPLLQGVATYEDVEFRVGAGEEGLSVAVWGSAPGIFSVGVVSPSGEYTSRLPARVDFNTVISFTFERTVLYVDYEIVEQRSGDQLILLRFSRPTEGIWTIRVFYDTDFPAVFDAWLPLRPFSSADTYFLLPNPDMTIPDPGNNNQAMTVAGYNHRTGGVYEESGRGYTRDQRVKPDFAAPCVQITGPAPGGGFVQRSGTSIAAAETAGGCALLFEYALVQERRLYMNGIELKKILIKGAVRDGANYPNRASGWGRLNFYDALGSLRGLV